MHTWNRLAPAEQCKAFLQLSSGVTSQEWQVRLDSKCAAHWTEREVRGWGWGRAQNGLLLQRGACTSLPPTTGKGPQAHGGGGGGNPPRQRRSLCEEGHEVNVTRSWGLEGKGVYLVNGGCPTPWDSGWAREEGLQRPAAHARSRGHLLASPRQF